MRLGKIEKHIILWYRRHNFGEMRNEYLSQSGAILNYARNILKYDISQKPATIKPHLPSAIYSKLHASFSRAFCSLDKKALILRATHSEVDFYNRERISPGVGVGFVKGRREKFYCLTSKGYAIPRKILTNTK